jgi:DNA polymerase
MEHETVLRQIAEQVQVCSKCSLSFSRKKAVPGEGPASAEIMLIGEGPGFYENEQGRPFVGAAGQFLDELLAKAGVNRKEVFITNVVKCRPPGNRDPQPEELLACSQYLEKQIEAINPLIIVTLGRYSMGRFLPNVRISEVHGQPAWVRGRLIIPMFHPAAALHQPSLKTSVERDFSRLPEWINQARQAGKTTAAYAAANTPAVGAEPPAPPPVRPQLIQQSFLLPEAPVDEPAEEESTSNPKKEKPTQLSLF